MQLIRDEIGAGKTDKEIYSKLEDEFGETVLYAPKFDMQTAALWLTPVSFSGQLTLKDSLQRRLVLWSFGVFCYDRF